MVPRLRILWIAFALLLFAGCKHPPSLVGTWKGTVLQEDAVAKFKDDKTVEVNIKQGTMGADLTGTYEATPKLLTITFTDYKLVSIPTTLSDIADTFFKGIKNKPMKLAYQFNTENEVALTYRGKTDVLKRDTSED